MDQDLEVNTKLDLLDKLVFTNPTALPASIDKELVGNYYLPKSVGIEIESTFTYGNLEYWKDKIKGIPGILDSVGDISEQRFRICKGYTGLVALYEALKLFIEFGRLNPESGIHYHVDFTEFSQEEMRTSFFEMLSKHENYLLGELDTWNYKGKYNQRRIATDRKSAWLNVRTYLRTVECRIGEMSYDYTVISKRIFHLTSILQKATNPLNLEVVKYHNLLLNLVSKLESTELKLSSTNTVSHEEIRQKIKSRKIKI